jgi:hypothetical protein
LFIKYHINDFLKVFYSFDALILRIKKYYFNIFLIQNTFKKTCSITIIQC